MKEQSAKWVKQAEYDLATAEAMFQTKRYVYVIFMCHLALEKMLKAVYTEVMEDYPPRIHSLDKLAQKAGVLFPDRMQESIGDLSELSIPTRYEDEARKIERKQAQSVLAQTREVFKWLRRQLK
jgi:HEPN domain-containing protein